MDTKTYCIRYGILTASDSGSRGERPSDLSGDAVRKCLAGLNAAEVCYAMLPDDKDLIAARLREWADRGSVDVVFTTGGTGLSPRDVTPEATIAVLDRLAPGFSEAMRAESLKKTSRAMLSRGVCGTRGRCLIINLPGSPRAVSESLEVILPVLPHAVEVLCGQARECAAEVVK
ncbi:MAG: MogA/MoaB family molybdenum cofactor biosynthesis protein [Dehalococcoidia bacterium]|nr:MogA/MoaB family molybdenum cofactor biosynthesis protein [Dehalococcoidia bacterium]